MRPALIALLGVLAGFALAGIMFAVVRAPAGAPIELAPRTNERAVAVHVIGAVPRPGFYEFEEGARVQDALEAAGGMLADGNAEAINLAARLEDGQQLRVPYIGDPVGAGLFPGGDDASGSGRSSGSPGELINLNTATSEQLDGLPGIGPTVAQQILDYRDDNGPFARTEELLNVPGVGPATFEGLKNLITV